jgi:hypothetical protein
MAIDATYGAPCLTLVLYMKFTPFQAKHPKNMTLPLRLRSTLTYSEVKQGTCPLHHPALKNLTASLFSILAIVIFSKSLGTETGLALESLYALRINRSPAFMRTMPTMPQTAGATMHAI